MELTNRQRKWYSLGAKMAEQYVSEESACWDMDADVLDDLACGKWSNSVWFHAGFIGRTPEYVEAVRFGEPPKDGQSKNHASGQLENGVSCVKIIREESDREIKSIYDITLGLQDISKNVIRGWYLGGSGSDGEPLLVDVSEN